MDNNLRVLRKKRGWSMRELAERISTPDRPVHLTAIARIEKDQQQLTQDLIVRLAEALEVTPNALLGRDPSNDNLQYIPTKRVPVIGVVSAGAWREAILQTDEFIQAPVNGAAFGLRIEGDSMDKVALDGSIVFVDPDQPDLHDGSYYVVMNDDSETTFKQYRSNPARLEPCSTNDQHQAIVMGRASFSIVGRVVGSFQPL